MDRELYLLDIYYIIIIINKFNILKTKGIGAYAPIFFTLKDIIIL